MPPVFSKLTSFFPPVTTDREKANNARNLARINMRSDERVEDSIERRLACLKNLNDKRLELKNQKLREARKRKHDGIDIVAPAPANLTDGAIAIEILSSDDDVTLPNKKKAWTQRPTIWADIAEFYLSVNNSIAATVKQYPNELGGNNDRQNYLCISRWVRDYKAGTVKKSVGGKPIYENEVDKQLYRTIIKRNDLGLPMDPFIMRTLLMIHLRDAGKQRLAKEHGGSLSQWKADELQQEYWEELMLYEEPETVEEISSGGDLVIATFEEPDSDLDD